MANWLVTGGAGFIGSNFLHYISKSHPEISLTNLDLLTYAGNLENLSDLESHPNYQFIQGNICDRQLVDKVLREKKIDTVVHFAAETHVDRSIHGPLQFIETNVTGTAILLESFRQYWLVENCQPKEKVRFHHISTDEVFGTLSVGEPAWTEESPYAPNSPYSASKAASDLLVRSYGHTYGLPFTISNCSNNYGPYQFPEKLIPLIILNALSGEPLPVYGDGQQIRDWLYVEDHCEAIDLILSKGNPDETYNIGGVNQPANITIVETICSLLDDLVPDSRYKPHRSLIKYVVDRPGHDRRYAMDITKINRDLGWAPRHSLENGLRKTVKWYLSNLGSVRNLTGQSGYQDWMQKNYNQRGGTAS